MKRRDFLWVLGKAAVTAIGGVLLTGCPDEGSDGDTVENGGPPSIEPRCEPRGTLPAALLTCRNWITFAPPRPFNPGQVPASEATLNSALSQLTSEGWRGLVTFTFDPTQGLDQVPRLAKRNGFTMVIAGLFIFDESQFQRERDVALAQVQHIDGFVLGNEVLQRNVPGFTRQRLITEIARLQADTSRPVTTSEPFNQYQNDPALLAVGDWVFPTLQFWFDPTVRAIPHVVV